MIVNVANRNQMRPSCAKVNVEVNLVAKFPQIIRINEYKDIAGEIKSKWIKVQYNYIPKYCRECYLQEHGENTYGTIHPKLFDRYKEAEETIET